MPKNATITVPGEIVSILAGLLDNEARRLIAPHPADFEASDELKATWKANSFKLSRLRTDLLNAAGGPPAEEHVAKPEVRQPETPSIAPIPPGWRRTQRAEFALGGIVWRSYRVGVNRYALVAEHAKLAVIGRNQTGTTYHARIDERFIGNRFKSENSAIEAAAKILINLA